MDKGAEAMDSEQRQRVYICAWVLNGGTWFPPLLESRGPSIDSREPEVSIASYSILKLELTMTLSAYRPQQLESSAPVPDSKSRPSSQPANARTSESRKF